MGFPLFHLPALVLELEIMTGYPDLFLYSSNYLNISDHPLV